MIWKLDAEIIAVVYKVTKLLLEALANPKKAHNTAPNMEEYGPYVSTDVTTVK